MADLMAASQRVLDFSTPLDVGMLDSIIQTFYAAADPQMRKAADEVMRTFSEHPDAWTRVDLILEKSQDQNTKFFGLQILEQTVKYKWGLLPMEQREGIKSYVSNVIINICKDPGAFRAQHLFLNKVNIILVQILKHDWPGRWRSFIPDLVAASKVSESLCENSLVILKLLSEEVFDFSKGEITAAKTKELKAELNNEFKQIYELCMFVLTADNVGTSLMRAALGTMHAFLSWVPLGYIFETSLAQTLLRLFPVEAYRNLVLKCLTEVGSLQVPQEHDAYFVQMYIAVMQVVASIIPRTVSLAERYPTLGDSEAQFVQDLALFLQTFFRAHLGALEANSDAHHTLLEGLAYLLQISYVDDPEVFKGCMDYWHHLVIDLFSQENTHPLQALPETSPFGAPGGAGASPRKQLYAEILSHLRVLMMDKMAKPEEVLLVEDENGNVVREEMKDADVVALYKVMREALVYLTHLNMDDTRDKMLGHLKTLHAERKEAQERARRGEPRSESWGALNRLCWAIGSVSGTMDPDDESRFLVMVIKDLLDLCEKVSGKDNKAAIASNIMYVVGQYPRFLRQHWKFLRTVVNKLFEFMHEKHPGVQDMACETFLKICSKCKRKFVQPPPGEPPFLATLLQALYEGGSQSPISDLEPRQVHLFYEAVGLMVGSATQVKEVEEYLTGLMARPNMLWEGILAQAAQNPDVLRDASLARDLASVLQTNAAVCHSLGPNFFPQLQRIFVGMLQVYQHYSRLVSAAVAQDPAASRTAAVKAMRTVKKAVLRLLEMFVSTCDEGMLFGSPAALSSFSPMAAVADQFMPAMEDPILGDFASSAPDARDAEVLFLYATLVDKLGSRAEAFVPKILQYVFDTTLGMITQDMSQYPEIRLRFFSLLRAINSRCFRVFFTMSSEQMKLVMDSIVWAIRHTERNVAETGLNLLAEMLGSFQSLQDFATPFHQQYFTMLLREVIAVMTDTFHKPGFKMHVRIMHHLFNICQDGTLKGPLWDASTASFPDNRTFVAQYTTDLLKTSFPNLTEGQIRASVEGMLAFRDVATFKNHLRDFLVQAKQFADADNRALYEDEVERQKQVEREQAARIAGILNPYEVLDELDSRDE